jgi:uncharacterized protein (TIGR04255 family)
MSNNQKKHDEITYKKNFLKQVIARIDFVSPLTSIDKEFPPKLSEKIRHIYPIVETKKSTMDEFELSKEGVKKGKKVQFTSWEFLAKNRKNKLVLDRNALLVSYTNYKSYETMREEFLAACQSLLEIFPDVQMRRLGLRYINEINLAEDNPYDWKNYLHQKTLSLLKFFPDPKYTCRVFNVLEYNYGDYMLRYQFGMSNPDYPAPIIKKYFVLDLDAHTEEQQDFGKLEQNMDRFHFTIQDMFEKSIKDGLRGKMNEK